ncbi:hypothetical protein FOMPIDRAFT_1052490 [Fomitopsis schrenkii]|uniref:Uncharacterized protein n=1 Tax=Fomitopsis schrenkii TaxID=2126942 RepID=S8F6K0_FOMSC|nr:hypothetical protein FOMPIDRAFT_1052490 [Fomitopsis schrenkii]
MSLNETTVNAHRIRFARLIDVLLADAAIEPQYQPSRSREWLAWAHGARWHLRAVLESYCHVTAAEPGSLPSPFAYREIKEMLDYLSRCLTRLAPASNIQSLLHVLCIPATR